MGIDPRCGRGSNTHYSDKSTRQRYEGRSRERGKTGKIKNSKGISKRKTKGLKNLVMGTEADLEEA